MNFLNFAVSSVKQRICINQASFVMHLLVEVEFWDFHIFLAHPTETSEGEHERLDRLNTRLPR